MSCNVTEFYWPASSWTRCQQTTVHSGSSGMMRVYWNVDLKRKKINKHNLSYNLLLILCWCSLLLLEYIVLQESLVDIKTLVKHWTGLLFSIKAWWRFDQINKPSLNKLNFRIPFLVLGRPFFWVPHWWVSTFLCWPFSGTAGLQAIK